MAVKGLNKYLNTNEFFDEEKQLPSSFRDVDISAENIKDGALSSDLVYTKAGKVVAVPRSDWSEFDPARFSYSSSTEISVEGLDATNYFQKGDRLWIIQGGSDVYLYVIDIASNLITVTGGDDYSVANDAIDYFAVSDKVNPTGFPTVFNYTASFSGELYLTTVIGSVGATEQFYIVGGYITVLFAHNVSLNNPSLGNTAYSMTLPVSEQGSGVGDPTYVIRAYSMPGQGWIAGPNNDLLIISRLQDGVPLVNGNHTSDASGIITYRF